MVKVVVFLPGVDQDSGMMIPVQEDEWLFTQYYKDCVS